MFFFYCQELIKIKFYPSHFIYMSPVGKLYFSPLSQQVKVEVPVLYFRKQLP